MRLLLLTLLTVSGCTFMSPENETRVTEYGANGNYLMQATGAVAGCRVTQTGATTGCLKVKTATCTYQSADC